MEDIDTFIHIGTMFHTGETAPVSGVYRFRSHTDGTCCLNYLAKFRINRRTGQTFPSHHRCKKSAIWKLEGYTTKQGE
jgi:hypothetical protein